MERIVLLLAWLLLVGGVGLGAWWLARQEEGFVGSVEAANETLPQTNPGQRPWERHDLHASVPVDLRSKYETAYNSELSNHAFEKALRKIFSLPCTFQTQYAREDIWTEVSIDRREGGSRRIQTVYGRILRHLQDRIRASSALDLPGETDARRTPIQVVHDVWRGLYRHKTEKGVYRIDLEVLLYRESKFHAKHVEFSCLLRWKTNQWGISILRVGVAGIVFEDHVGIFPVVARDPVDAPQASFSAKSYASEDMFLMEPDEVRSLIQAQREKMQTRLRTNQVLGLTPWT